MSYFNCNQTKTKTMVVTKNRTARTAVNLESIAAFVLPVFLRKKESPESGAAPAIPRIPGSLPSCNNTTQIIATQTTMCKTVNTVLISGYPPIHAKLSVPTHILFLLYHKFFILQEKFFIFSKFFKVFLQCCLPSYRYAG